MSSTNILEKLAKIPHIDLQPPCPRGCSSKHRHCKSCYARQYEHEDNSNHDYGISARDVLCSSVCCTVVAMGQADRYWEAVLGLLGSYDSDHNSSIRHLVWYDVSREVMWESEREEQEG
jgi:hypothetical protein